MSNLFGFVSNDDFITEMEKLIAVHGGLDKTAVTFTGNVRFLYYTEQNSKGYAATNLMKSTAFTDTGGSGYLHTSGTLPLKPGIIETIGVGVGTDTYVATDDGTALTLLGSYWVNNTYYKYYAYTADEYSAMYLRLSGSNPTIGAANLYTALELDVDTDKNVYVYSLSDEKLATILGNATSALYQASSFDFGDGVKLVQQLGSESATLIPKNITQNGTYAASSDGVDGYSSVDVNISQPIGTPVGIINGVTSSVIGQAEEAT
ncbi:MAG: hypothetical protein IJ740_03670 [Ruminococcus sp.]|nr:hypothetical protein [Ruminococcus sp.]